MKDEYFDSDQAISKIHVFKQLVGWEPGVEPPRALSERGQIHRLKLLSAAQYNFQTSTRWRSEPDRRSWPAQLSFPLLAEPNRVAL